MKNTLQNSSKIFLFLLIIVFMIGQLVVVKAEAKNNNPMLKDIRINGNEIEPTFEMFTTEYIVQVPEETTQIQIEAIPDDENANVEIIGNTKNLEIGRNEIEIKVTAEDGIATQSYYIFVTRGKKENINANLKSLVITDTELAPTFDSNIINYAVEYPKDLEQLKIEATPEEEEATVNIIGNENLTEITQTIKIQVTAQDGQTQKTYYVIAKKAGMEVESPEGMEIEQTNENTKENTSENIPLKVIAILIIIIIVIIIIISISRKTKNKKNSEE